MAFKAFNKGMTCNGKQYAENTVFEEPEADLCRVGMHYCENPLGVLNYYDLVTSEGELITAAEVEPLGEVKTDGIKSVTTKLRIGAKLSFSAFVKAGVDFLIERTKTKSTNTDGGKKNAQIGSSGYGAKIGSSGYGAQIGSSGDLAQIGSSGYGAKIGSSGDLAQIGSSGNLAQIGSSGYGAQIGSSGDLAQIGSSGYGAKIGSSGYGAKIGSSGKNAVVCCAGHGCVVKAKKGSWITLSEWKEINGEWVPVCVKTEQVDGERIREDTLYMLKGGEFVEVQYE